MYKMDYSKITDEQLIEMRSNLECELHDVDLDNKYLYLNGEIPNKENRNYKDIYLDRGYILDRIRLVNKELANRGIREDWMC